MVNALSSRLEAEVRNSGHIWTQSFHRGVPETKHPKKGASVKKTGTTITFWPDTDIFVEGVDFDIDTVVVRLREMAFLNRGLEISLTDERGDEPFEQTFQYKGGLIDFVKQRHSRSAHT